MAGKEVAGLVVGKEVAEFSDKEKDSKVIDGGKG